MAEHGHVALGFHADAVYGHLNFGIPGVSGAYSVRLVNLTPIPLLTRGCRLFRDIAAPDESPLQLAAQTQEVYMADQTSDSDTPYRVKH
jgi:hypothetical protein